MSSSVGFPDDAPPTPRGFSSFPARDPYSSGPSGGPAPTPPLVAGPRSTRSRRQGQQRGRRAILALCIVAIGGALLVGVGQIIAAFSYASLVSAENTCAYGPQSGLVAGCSISEELGIVDCNENVYGYRLAEVSGANPVEQALEACDNATVTETTLTSIGAVVSLAAVGGVALLMISRRMDRIEAGTPPA